MTKHVMTYNNGPWILRLIYFKTPSILRPLTNDNKLYSMCIYSGPSYKGKSLEKTPFWKGHKFLAANPMNVNNTSSH